MKIGFSACVFICLVSLSLWSPGTAQEDVVYKPLHVGTFTTFGVIKAEPSRQIFIGGGGGAWTKYENQPFSRTAVNLAQEVIVNDALLMSVGVGGFIYYPLPEEEGKFWTRNFRLKGSLSKAAGTYHFGGLESPWLRLKMGYFPYKYNPDARNLGEYLLRSGTYPGTTFTGGWIIVNSAAYMTSGLLGSMSFLENRLKLDVGIFMERGQEPNFDLSPGILASYDLGGMLEFGAGIVFSHLVPMVPEKVTPEERSNAYHIDSTGREMPLIKSERLAPGLNDSPTADPLVSAVRPNGDSLVGVALPAGHPSREILIEKGKTAQYISDSANGISDNQLSYYTFKGQKVMARAAFRPQRFLQSDLLGPDDLTLFAEVALLGIKNYPFFYEKRSERMPVMFGINLPTFKFLDVLALEFEYHKRRFRNTTYSPDQYVRPLYALGENDMSIDDAQEWIRLENNSPLSPAEMGLDLNNPEDLEDYQNYLTAFAGKAEDWRKFHGDPDWWWSLYAKKTIMPGFRIHLQVAKDHFRAIGSSLASSFEPIFHRKGLFEDYYWALKLEFGI